MAHILFGSAWVYHCILLSVFAHHNGHRCLPRTENILPHLRLATAAARQRRTMRPGLLASHGVRTNNTLASAGRGAPGGARAGVRD